MPTDYEFNCKKVAPHTFWGRVKNFCFNGLKWLPTVFNLRVELIGIRFQLTFFHRDLPTAEDIFFYIGVYVWGVKVEFKSSRPWSDKYKISRIKRRNNGRKS